MDHGFLYAPWHDLLDLCQQFFPFIRTCANLALRPDRLICLSIRLFYHIHYGYRILFFCAALP